MLPAHSATSLCRRTVGSGAQSLAPTASALQWSPEENNQRRGYCPGIPGPLVVL